MTLESAQYGKPPKDYVENGREYHGYRKGKYMFPCDESEKDRMDIFHKFFLVARRDTLHSAPFTPNYDGPRIMDLGCGTGIWAIDMADKYPHAEIKGYDLSNIQPASIPNNVSFAQRDIESPWHGFTLESWDLIHIRMLNGSIESWPELYQKVFMHLKPGFGWIEHVEMDISPRSDDGTLEPTSSLANWSRFILEATGRFGRPLAYNTETREMLERAGFVEISEQVIKVPLNPWPTDPHLKDIGRWYNLGLTQGLEALTLGPLTRMSNWSKPNIDKLIQEVKRDVCSKKIHAYCNMHIWIARRPADA